MAGQLRLPKRPNSLLPSLLSFCNTLTSTNRQVYPNMANSDVVKSQPATKSARIEAGTKLRDADKMSLIPVKIMPVEREQMLRKPEWLKVKLPTSSEKIDKIKQAM